MRTSWKVYQTRQIVTSIKPPLQFSIFLQILLNVEQIVMNITETPAEILLILVTFWTIPWDSGLLC